MASRSYGQFCALSQALDRVGERWTILIVRELLAGPARFRELKDALPGVASNLLTQRLRAMESDQLIVRRTLPAPSGVNVYELTDQGRALEPILNLLALWGVRYLQTARYRDPGGPRGLMLALRLVLPHHIGANRGASIALVLSGKDQPDQKDQLGITINKRGTVEISLEPPPAPELTLALPYRRAFALLLGQLELREGVRKKWIKTTGSAAALATLAELFAHRNGKGEGDDENRDGKLGR